jgi:hypothetical protein
VIIPPRQAEKKSNVAARKYFRSAKGLKSSLGHPSATAINLLIGT